jgi:hypothetical protein
MNTLQHATAFNNKGVRFLEGNNAMKAIESFQCGIQLIKRYTQNDECCDRVELDCGKHQLAMGSCGPHMDTKGSHRWLHAGMKIIGLQRGFYYSYDRPFLLPTNALLPPCEENTSNVYLICVILTFNLAMSYQNYATQHGNTSALRHAISAYTLAASMVESADFDRQKSDIIMYLIMNNLANLHYELCDYCSYEYWLNRLKVSLHKDVNMEFVSECIEEDEWIELQLNSMYGLIAPVASAA